MALRPRVGWVLLGWALACQPGVEAEDPNGPRPENRQSSLPLSMASGVGHVALTGCVGFDFLAQFNVGGQPFHLLVDSGSTTLALARVSCSTCKVPDAYRLSSTARLSPHLASSRYLDGSEWLGTVIEEQVAVGTLEGLVTPAVPVSIVGIDKEKGFFQSVSCTARADTAFDGIVGFGLDAQLEGNTTSFLSSLVQANALSSDAFALQTCDVGGDLWLGGYDASRTLAAPEYTPLLGIGSRGNRNNAYTVDLAALAIGGQDLDPSAASLGPMVVDNGTNALVLSKDAFVALQAGLEADANFRSQFDVGFLAGARGDCAPPKDKLTREGLDALLPKLTMTFPRDDGTSFDLVLPATQSYLVAGVSDGDADRTVRYCPAVIAGSKLSLLGNVAMRGHVVVFDRAGGRIGFAPQSGCRPTPIILPAGT